MFTYKKELPLYWQQHLFSKLKEIRAIKDEAGEDAPCFALVTDFHIAENEGYSVELIRRVLDECDIPFVISAGDAASGKGICTADFLKGEIREFLSAFAPVGEKLLFVEGNHDRAFSTFEPPLYYKENIPRCELDEICFERQRKYGNRRFGGYGYYYVDDEKSRMRIILLNGQDVPSDAKTAEGYAKYNAMRHFGFLQEQIDWFCSEALRLPSEEWVGVVCSHSDFQGAKKEKHCYNYELMLGIINAFNQKSSYNNESSYEDSAFNASVDFDFSEYQGKVVGWVSGHTHNDRINETYGVTSVSTTTDAAFLSTNPEKAGTLNEQAFDAFIIDRKRKLVKIVRVGVGENREFSY
jgi:predicted phosphodiesterase